jgi:AraC-like DNA-binding protein
MSALAIYHSSRKVVTSQLAKITCRRSRLYSNLDHWRRTSYWSDFQDIINRDAKPGPSAGQKCEAFHSLNQVVKMRFRSYRPSRPLSDFVETFWLCDGYASPHLRERIFPNGTFGLVFNLHDGDLRIYRARHPDRCTRLPGAVVSGPYGGYFITDRAAEASVMGVGFKPGGAFPFLGLGADELLDTHASLQDIWGRGALEIRERISAQRTDARRLQILQDALLSRLVRRPERHPAVLSALDYFRRNPSRPIVGNVAREVGLSNRRFIDVFNFQVGVKPKLFLRIQRFQRVLQKVHLLPVVDWGQLALEQGYFDQSHLIRDFVAFSGISPADYLRRLRDLRNDGTHPIKFHHLPLAG